MNPRDQKQLHEQVQNITQQDKINFTPHEFVENFTKFNINLESLNELSKWAVAGSFKATVSPNEKKFLHEIIDHIRYLKQKLQRQENPTS